MSTQPGLTNEESGQAEIELIGKIQEDLLYIIFLQDHGFKSPKTIKTNTVNNSPETQSPQQIRIASGEFFHQKRLSLIETTKQNATSEAEYMIHLFEAIENMTEGQQIEKAIRHLQDGINLRPARNDLDRKERKQNQRKKNQNFFLKSNLFSVDFILQMLELVETPKVVRFIYYFQTNLGWEYILRMMCYVYMFLVFFEPSNRYVRDQEINEGVFYLESVIVICFLIDVVFETIHRFYDIDRPFKEQFLLNNQFLLKIIVFLMIGIDYLYFYSVYPGDAPRFARYVRPGMMLFYSTEMRRIFKSLLYSFKQIIQLVIFFLVSIFFFALLGWRFIGDMDGGQEYDIYRNNFNDFFKAAYILYNLITFDDYPAAILPAVRYMNLFLLVFLPIPVAVVFEAYRNNRSKLVIEDRIKQREALMCSFMCLDFHKYLNRLKKKQYVIFLNNLKSTKSLTEDTFTQFMSGVYQYKKRYLKRIKELYLNVDKNDNDTININEFFDVIEIIDGNPFFEIPFFSDFEWWRLVRKFFNHFLKFQIIAKSKQFDAFMFVVLGVNCGVLIAASIVTDQDQLALLDDLDDILLYFYIMQCVLQIFGLGIQKYFQDDWNQFDFILVVISLTSNALNEVLTVLRSAQSAKAGKLIRLTQLNRVFKVFRAVRTIKFFNVIAGGADALIEVKWLIVKTLMCIPLSKNYLINSLINKFLLVFQMVPILLSVYYLFAILGMDCFNTNTFTYREGSIYTDNEYTNFNSLQNALLILFQTTIEAGWAIFVYDYSYKFDSFARVAIYFISFHLIVVFVLLSIVKGIVWEVFQVVDSYIKDKQREKSLKELEQNYNQEKDYVAQKEKEALIEEIQKKSENNSLKGTQQIRPNRQTEEQSATHLFAEQQKKQELMQLKTATEKYDKQLRAASAKDQRGANFQKDKENLINNNILFKINNLDESKLDKISSVQEDIFANIYKEKTPQEKENFLAFSDYNADKLREGTSDSQKNKNIKIQQSLGGQDVLVDGTGSTGNPPGKQLSNNQYFNPNDMIIEKAEYNISPDLQAGRRIDRGASPEKVLLTFDEVNESQENPSFLETPEQRRLQFLNNNRGQLGQVLTVTVPLEDNLLPNKSINESDNAHQELLENKKQFFTEQDNSISILPSNISKREKQNSDSKISEDEKIEGAKGQLSQYQLMQLNQMKKHSESFESSMQSGIEESKIIGSNNLQLKKEQSNVVDHIMVNLTDEDKLRMKEEENLTKIVLLRKRFKSIQFLISRQRREQPQTQSRKDFNYNNDFFLSDDQEAMKIYMKELEYMMNENQKLSKDQDIKILLKYRREERQRKLQYQDQAPEEQEDAGLNQNYIMKKALLKQANIQLVQRIEIDYFQERYGTFFNEINAVDVKPIIRIEGFILYSLRRSLRHQNSDPNLFSQVIKHIQQITSDVIFRKGSLFKFLFQDNLGNWFSLKFSGKAGVPFLLNVGPWDYVKTVLQKENEIYLAKDFFNNDDHSDSISELLVTFYDSLKICAQGLGPDMQFIKINPNKGIFDVYSMYFDIEKQANVINYVEKKINKNQSIQENLPVFVKRCMVLLISYRGEPQNTNQKKTTNFNLIETQQRKTEEQSGGNFSKIRLNFDDLKKTQIKEKDLINEKSSLPFSYIKELFKSFQDIIGPNQQNFFIKMTEILNLRVKDLNDPTQRGGYQKTEIHQNNKD